MGRLVVTQFVSLDGVTEDPHKWSLQYWNDDIAKFKHDELFAADVLLLGRVTYEGFAASWPSRSGDDYTDRINSMPKVAVSKTLDSVEWNNSRVIKNDVPAQVAKLKEETGGDVLVFGSMTLVNSLMPSDLIDEYRLLVYPVVLGSGKRLFTDASEATLKMTTAKPFGSDVALLTYEPAR